MKFLFAVLLVVVLCFCFVSCVPTPFKTVKTSPKHNILTIYVCGAVQNEGFVEVPEGSTYALLAEKAGIIAQTHLPTTAEQVIAPETTVFSLPWAAEGTVFYCLNVNGGAVRNRRAVECVESAVIDKIASYLEQHGTISDRTRLREILGDDYQNNYYKFFVSVDDYEKVD